ncbi:MAG: ArnT family glycosyltransferase [Phycisphaerae bacterium]
MNDSASPLKYVRWLMALIVTAFAIRLAVGLVHPLTLPDSVDYLHLARRIDRGQSYIVTGMYAKRLPGYPIFLALILAADGGRLVGIIIAQAVLGAVTVYLTWSIARRISDPAALFAAALVAFDPLLIGFAASYLSETLFTMLFLWSLLIFLQLCQHDSSLWRWLYFSLLFAAAIYVRAEISLGIFPLLAFYLGWGRLRPILARLARVLFSVAVVFLCLLPWWVRNWELFHADFFRFSTLQGISLYESVYHGATGGPRQSDIVRPPAFMRLSESRRDLVWTHRAFTCITQHPWRIIRLAFIKIGRTWSPWLHAKGFRKQWINAILTLWYSSEFILSLIGLGWLIRRRQSIHLLGVLLIPIGYLTAMHAIFLGSVRYRVPVMPLVCILAAAGIVCLWSLVSSKRQAPLQVPPALT